MHIEFSPAKNQANIAKHGMELGRATLFLWESALILADTRKDYGEPRFIARGLIGNRLHVLIFTHRGSALRIISLRKANAKERGSYEKEK